MGTRRAQEYIVRWNEADSASVPRAKIRIHDETLRDGLQSPSVRQPTLDEKLELIWLMDRLGIDTADVGMPITSQTMRGHVKRLADEVASNRLALGITCAARSTDADIAVTASIMQETGVQIGAMIFIGISPIRMYVEEWTVASVLRKVDSAVAFARREGLEICLVTEDTTRSRPDVALDVYVAALQAGAERICVCDTVGYATPWGAAAVVTQIQRGLALRGFPGVSIEWHGHNDRGLAVANSLAAIGAGAACVHGTAVGIGERAGNAPMEQLLANLDDLGWRSGDLSALPRYCDLTACACNISVPGSHPFVGSDVYCTATGVHAAAIRKAQQLGDNWLAERVYSGIPASAVGREQTIEIGPGSGRANVLSWLEAHGISGNPALVRRVQEAVASADHLLVDHELLALVTDPGGPGRHGADVADRCRNA
jgi:isopropylmalate/homocitrate/citramalate synthase